MRVNAIPPDTDMTSSDEHQKPLHKYGKYRTHSHVELELELTERGAVWLSGLRNLPSIFRSGRVPAVAPFSSTTDGGGPQVVLASPSCRVSGTCLPAS